MDGVDARNRDLQLRQNVSTCAECGIPTGSQWTGWRAYRTDDLYSDEQPSLALFCPSCAKREFGILVR
jgi:hypothetical protein